MLLNEFLKEHRKVEELEATVAPVEGCRGAASKGFRCRLKEQDAKIQMVSDKLEMSKPVLEPIENR